MNVFLMISIVILCLIILLSLIRGAIGPTSGDRLISINVVGTKVIILIGIISVLTKESGLIDVMLIYGLINFIATIFIGRQISTDQIEKDKYNSALKESQI